MLQSYLGVDYVLFLHDRNDRLNEHRLREKYRMLQLYLDVEYVLCLYDCNDCQNEDRLSEKQRNRTFVFGCRLCPVSA